MLPASAVSGDKYFICPYDETHRILAKSFDAHLIKCRENHKGCKMRTCPLDHRHVIPAPEYSHHIAQCDKRSLMDREMQKRAGDNGLKGDVIGPPIVADHGAGQALDDWEEDWDGEPQRTYPTPALFNDKVPNATPESYGIIPGGGYVLQRAEEPVIRKIPKTPGMAASLSNPMASAPLRPSRNQVFEFSLNNNRPALNSNASNSWSQRPPLLKTPPASTRMAGVRPPAPVNFGPRFIGRGISKYATKSNQNTSSDTPVLPKPNDFNCGVNLKTPLSTSSDAGLFENSVAPPGMNESPMKSDSHIPAFNSSHHHHHQQQQHQQASEIASYTSMSSGYTLPTAFDAGLTNNAIDYTNNASNSLQSQQLVQQALLLYEKQKHQEQQQELEKKHQLQLLQLQKLQNEEKQRLAEEHERRIELFVQNQALRQSPLNSSDTTSSSSSSAAAFPNLSSLPVELMESLMQAMRASGMQTQSLDFPSDNLTQGNITQVGQDNESSTPAVNTNIPIPDVSNSETKKDSELEAQESKESLQKKLREINILEQKASLGHVLSKEETSKLNSKEELQQQIASLPSD